MMIVVTTMGSSSTAPDYVTAFVDVGTVEKTVVTTGQLSPRRTIRVGAEVSGRIERVLVDVNDRVRAGDLLAAMEPSTFAFRVQLAEASVAQAQARLRETQSNIESAESEVGRTRAALDRVRRLSSQDFAAQQALDDADVAHAQAVADLASAQARSDAIAAEVAQREAERAQARLDLERAEIRSPIDGVVIARSVDEGQALASSFQTPNLFVIAADLSEMRLEAFVHEADIGALTVGNPVSFRVQAFRDQEFSGVIEKIELAPSEKDYVVTYPVIMSISNDDRRLFPGMTADIEIVIARKENVIRMPKKALLYNYEQKATRVMPTVTIMSEEELERRRAQAQVRAQIQAIPSQKNVVWLAPYDKEDEPDPAMIRKGLEGDAFIEILDDSLQPGQSVILSQS